MPTGALKGLTPNRKVGSGPDNKGLTSYAIASGYATSLGLGDPVKLSADGAGTLVKATNGADAIGVFAGVKYTDSEGSFQFKKLWTASTVATDIVALVTDDPFATFTAVANGPTPLAMPGAIFAADVAVAPNSATGRSNLVVLTAAVRTGTLAVTGTNNAALTGLANGDTFTIRTSNPANSAVTITIVTNQTPAQLLALLNAVPGISAQINAGTNFLQVTSNDGYNIVLADGTGTPLTDSGLIGTAGTITALVAANAGLVKVIKRRDVDTFELEVVLVNDSLRDDG